MYAHQGPQSSSPGSRAGSGLVWLGGGDWHDAGDRQERSTYSIAGAVVLLGALLAWLVATLAVAGSTHWPVAAILPCTLLVGVLVGGVSRTVASGSPGGLPAIAGRAAVAVAAGVLIGELATLALLAGSIDGRLDEQAARHAQSVPVVAQAQAALDRRRDARATLDNEVATARNHRDDALVVARCEYNPSPACPQTQITGVPGTGPETRTANQLLAGAQRELDSALSARDRKAPGLDAAVADAENTVAQARASAVADADRGLGAHWVALNGYSRDGAGALTMRLSAIAFFVLVTLLPLILRLWRGETTTDRRSAARAERDRAELGADTAIAVKRAEVREAAETLWAEQQLVNARFAVEAQTEIDRQHHRCRVTEALELSPASPVEGTIEAELDNMYLPIAAEAEAASRTAAELPAARQDEQPPTPENLPVKADAGGAVEPSTIHRGSLIPTIPDVTKVAARWIRPLVPPLVARAIDTTTHPLRTAREVFEEFEEITFALRRTRKVTFNAEESAAPPQQPAAVAVQTRSSRRVEPSSVGADPEALGASGESRPSIGRAARGDLIGPAAKGQLIGRDRPSELGGPNHLRELPPAT
jgi:Domain of unknown function (DUF4407)